MGYTSSSGYMKPFIDNPHITYPHIYINLIRKIYACMNKLNIYHHIIISMSRDMVRRTYVTDFIEALVLKKIGIWP